MYSYIIDNKFAAEVIINLYDITVHPYITVYLTCTYMYVISFMYIFQYIFEIMIKIYYYYYRLQSFPDKRGSRPQNNKPNIKEI